VSFLVLDYSLKNSFFSFAHLLRGKLNHKFGKKIFQLIKKFNGRARVSEFPEKTLGRDTK
jgi:hypothetical protein